MQIHTSTQKLITFSHDLYQLGSRRAKKLGIPFAEYIRFLLVNDVKEESIDADIETLDAQTDAQIGQALADIRQGNYSTAQDANSLQKHLDSLKQK